MGATLVERAPFHTLPSAYHWNLLESVAYPQIRLRKGRETKRKQQRERDKSSSSYSVPLPELKMDSWRNAAMAVSRDYACSPPSNTWDSFTLVGHNDSATNTRPPSGREEREGGRISRRGDLPSYNTSQRTQRLAYNGSRFAQWWTTTNWVLLLYYKCNRKEPHNSQQ